MNNFSACLRIRKRKQFLAVYAAGKKLHSQHFLLFAKVDPGEPQRVGFAVSRKVGNAVKRNRVKRILREFVRRLAFSLPGMQLVIVAKTKAYELGLGDTSQELLPLLERLAGIK